jgi:hypothetical protein
MGVLQASYLLILAISVAWLVPFFSGRGILVADQNDMTGLDCYYFAATSFAKRHYYYSENGVMGKSHCLRITVIAD